MDQQSDTKRLSNLTSLRAIAAILIFVYHLYFFSPSFRTAPMSESDQWINLIIGHFDLAVPFFFVLSGFLVGTRTVQQLQNSKHKVPSLYLFRRRFLRIGPLFLLIILIGVLGQLGLYFPNFNPSDYLCLSFPFKLIYDPSYYHPFLSPLWTVAVEEHIYLILFTFLLIPKLQQTNWVLVFFLVLISISLCYRGYYNSSPKHIYYHTLSGCGYIGLGGLIACINHSRFVQPLSKLLSRAVMLLVYLIGLYVLLIISVQHSHFFNHPIFQFIFFGPLFSCIIINQAFSEQPLLKADKLFGLNALGKMSYGFYVYSSLIIFILNQLPHYLDFTVSTTWFIPYGILAFFLTLGLSWISYKWFESIFYAMRTIKT